MGATCGAGTAYPSGAHEFTPVFSGVRISRSLIFWVFFVDHGWPFSLGHCIVCHSSNYGFCLPLCNRWDDNDFRHVLDQHAYRWILLALAH